MDKAESIFVAGHRGLVGSSLLRELQSEGYRKLLLRDREKLDLTRQGDVERFFQRHQPRYVFLAAAMVGGIGANDRYGADFIYQNLMIQSNVIEAAYRSGIERLLFLGSSCVYPRNCPQPMREDYLLTSELESTNEAYAVAKIAGIKMCEHYNRQHGTRYLPIMPTNLYGPGDNFDLQRSHVLPALLRKAHEAKINNLPEMVVWGSGKPLREFMHVDDLARACVFLMRERDETRLMNIGTQEEISIAELAALVCEVVGFQGNLTFDTSRPDGTPRKLLDSNRLRQSGWRPRITLREGLRATYRWFVANYMRIRQS